MAWLYVNQQMAPHGRINEEYLKIQKEERKSLMQQVQELQHAKIVKGSLVTYVDVVKELLCPACGIRMELFFFFWTGALCFIHAQKEIGLVCSRRKRKRKGSVTGKAVSLGICPNTFFLGEEKR